MKAWRVREKDQFFATIVFAETRGKARSLALSTECCEDADFCDIEVYRQPQVDKCYVDGKKEMDWFNPQDRIALVKDCGFVCSTDYFEPEDCKSCSAAKYCDQYKDYTSEMDGKGEG